MTSKIAGSIVGAIALLGALGANASCERDSADVARARAAATSGAESNAAQPAKARVTKIVFVGKKNACDCTRARVAKTWKALQEALGKPPKVPVEKLQVDTQAEQVAPYRKQKAIIAIPALYFLDQENKVSELLQGEVTREQIAAALGSSA